MAAIALVLALPAAAPAETRYVAKGGSTHQLHELGPPCATITHAAGQAANGDTIQIGPGIYTESVPTDKVLTFIGAGGGTLDGLPAVTLIRGPAGPTGTGSPALELPNGGKSGRSGPRAAKAPTRP